MADLFTRLREETQDEHRQLETRLDLLGDGLSRDRYRLTLERFFGYVEPYESALVRLAPNDWADFIAPRLRAPWLRADLRSLGASDADVDRLPRADTLPAMTDLASLVGCMYVQEGSTLGGRVIAPQLQQRLGLAEDTGARYFHGHGAHTGRLWTDFRHRAAAALSEGQHDAAIAAARDSFAAMRRWLTRDTARLAA